MSALAMIKEKTASKAILKRYAEIGSHCLGHLSNLKYSVVLPSLITHDSGFFLKICIHFQNSLANPKVFDMHTKKEWLIESKALSTSTVINNPSVSKELVISRTSDFSLLLSLINILLTYATWFSFTMVEITLLKQLDSTFEISFISTFRSKIGH